MIPVTELEMAANTTFASILNEIQLSNLNFTMTITPFAANIILKKTLQKDLNGVLVTPAPPLLHSLQQTQKQNNYLQVENARLNSVVNILEKKYDDAIQEIKHLNDSLGEAKKVVNDLSCAKRNLQSKVNEVVKEAAINEAKKSEHEMKLRENQKKHNSELKELRFQVKDLNSAIKTKVKENYDLNKALENARATLKSCKAEKSQLKMCKTRLETEVRKLELKQQQNKKEIVSKTSKSKNWDENANFKTVDLVATSDSSGSMFIPSMVSHFNPHIDNTFQRPTDIASMITHCILSPPPGSSLLSMVEVMEGLEKAVEKMIQTMNMMWSSTSSSSV